jgi:hypothetical protein
LNNLYSQIDTGTKKLAQLTKDLADTTAKTTTNLVTSGLNSLKAKLAVVDKVKAIPGALVSPSFSTAKFLGKSPSSFSQCH